MADRTVNRSAVESVSAVPNGRLSAEGDFVGYRDIVAALAATAEIPSPSDSQGSSR
jgi:hypothetical protein